MALHSNFYRHWLGFLNNWVDAAQPKSAAAKAGSTSVGAVNPDAPNPDPGTSSKTSSGIGTEIGSSVGSEIISDRANSLGTETHATCDNCLMADTPRVEALMRAQFANDPAAKRDPGPFKADLKCCTYQPYLPNFVVGELLKSQNPRLNEMFDFWLGSGALQPQGLILGGEITAEEMAEGFGINEELLCPFLDRKASRCTIWAARPGVCSSYQCVSQRGSRGQEFWSEIEAFVNLFEWTLAHEVLWRMGWTEDDLERAEDLAGSYSDESVFLDHAGQEREFYLRTRELALGVSSDQLLELLGPGAEDARVSISRLSMVSTRSE